MFCAANVLRDKLIFILRLPMSNFMKYKTIGTPKKVFIFKDRHQERLQVSRNVESK
jgi:hypothetical protein